MSVFGLLRPKWQHPDPAVRIAAVNRLSDQAVLAQIVEQDADENVRLAAFGRVTDQDLLAGIARSRSPFSVRAVEVLAEPRLLARIAREAEMPRAREVAVGRIDDALTLQQIAAHDPDPNVRRQARLRRRSADGAHRVLRSALEKLQVAERSAAGVAEFCGALDEVCGALLRDPRFRIDGVLHAHADESAGQQSTHVVELLARKTETAGRGGSYYQIRVWRPAEDAFHCCVEERTCDTSHDLEAWSRSSSGA